LHIEWNKLKPYHLSLVESWNDNNPTEKLSPELIDLIGFHLNMAYMAGFDELSRKLLDEIVKNDSDKISKYYLRCIIMNYNEID